MNSTVSKQSTAAPSDRYYFCATAILVLGIVLRQWALGVPSFHPDEAIHTHFSAGFANYKYDPVYHGPLLYHLVAAVFGLFGQHDYTARLVPSLLGVGLLGLILGPMRPYLGNRGALASAALVAVSPSIVSYSRRLLHDSLVLFLTLGAVWCFLIALENGANTARGRNARIGVVAFLTLFLTTKANCFFIAAMLGAFYFAWRLAGLIKIPSQVTKWAPPLLFLFLNAAAIALPRDNTYTELIKDAQHKVFVIMAVGACCAFGLWLLTRQTGEEEQTDKKNWRQSSDLTTYVLAAATALWLYVFLFGNGAQILTQWAHDLRHFPSQTLADGSQNARSAISKMLQYWGGQQKTPRLPGRHDYYIVLALLYEVPVLLAALGGIWYAAKNRSTLTDLLLWWSFTSWAIYAVANEKVPWLLVHSILPLALLGGVWLGQVRWKKPVLAAVGVAGFLVAMRGVSGVNFERGGDNDEPMLYAQTPEAFHDALNIALENTINDNRPVWMAGERQWPTVWYLRSNAPGMNKSGYAIGGKAPNDQPSNVSLYRAVVTEEAQWPAFEKAGWIGTSVDFLVWPRASWPGIAPQRYFRWFWTRQTIPAQERKLSQSEWNISILSGKGEWSKGEWSHATAVVGYPPQK
jgi:uncharacterized protein (TIGR03663 family)